MCITNEYSLVHFIAFLGSISLFCAQRFRCHVNNVVDGLVNHIINRYVHNLVEDLQLQTACFVPINIRDYISSLFNSFVFTHMKFMVLNS